MGIHGGGLFVGRALLGCGRGYTYESTRPKAIRSGKIGKIGGWVGERVGRSVAQEQRTFWVGGKGGTGKLGNLAARQSSQPAPSDRLSVGFNRDQTRTHFRRPR